MSRSDEFYATRHGLVPASGLDEFRAGAAALIAEVEREGLFQVQLGFQCVDGPFQPGALGADVAAISYALTSVRFWPLSERMTQLIEHEIFTALEFLHDHAASPVDSHIHDFGECGIHVETGDEQVGQQEFRRRINPILARYSDGYELSKDGEVNMLAPTGLDFEAVQLGDPAVDDRVKEAVRSFSRYGARETEQRQAVRQLADVLEYLRSSIGTQLPRQDEDRLFEIANSYAIRHYNPKQRTDYDERIWLRWIYHAYLNSIDLSVQLIHRTGEYEVTRCPACHQNDLYSDSYGEVDADGALSGGNFRACSNCGWNSTQ